MAHQKETEEAAPKKQGHAGTVLLVFLFLLGMAVLLYPSVSNYYNQLHTGRVVSSYDKKMQQLPSRDFAAALQAAHSYNRILLRSPLPFREGVPVDKTYQSLLNPVGSGMMGYISIQKLGLLLPVYHGTSAETLGAGVGHLEGSSLPVGGAGTHAILTGHRGLPEAKLFTDLDRMRVGDQFVLHIMNQTLTYQVDRISVVLPTETSGLSIVPGKDYVTLVTCTPYGINSHRMLVRGVRVKNAVPPVAVSAGLGVEPGVAAAVLLPAAVLVFLLVRRHRRGKETEAAKGEEKT